MDNRPDEFIPTRATLLNRLKDWGDQESWDDFFAIYRRLILSTARKAGLTEPEAEDVLQETVLSVAKTIKDFQYDRRRCTFKSWLRHLTQRRIADRFRKRSREPAVAQAPAETTERTALLERLPDPDSLNLEAIWEAEWQQKLLEAAIERVKHRASPEQFQIFDFCVLRSMPAKKVAAALDVSVAQVYLAKHRISGLVKKEVKHLEARMG